VNDPGDGFSLGRAEGSSMLASVEAEEPDGATVKLGEGSFDRGSPAGAN
jgi:hypothetical protein